MLGLINFWVSLSGEYLLLGFAKLPMANTYLVGIVFDKIPERTLVWSANRDDEAQAGSNISLTSTGGFVLIHKNGTEVSIYNGKDICSASMSDNGNFMLFDSSSSIPTWQSFGHPTDNLLAGTGF